MALLKGPIVQDRQSIDNGFYLILSDFPRCAQVQSQQTRDAIDDCKERERFLLLSSVRINNRRFGENLGLALDETKKKKFLEGLLQRFEKYASSKTPPIKS